MDLSRLNLSALTRLGRRARSFREFLAQVLEGERDLIEPETRVESEELPFDRNDDLTYLNADLARLTRKGEASITSVFGALAPHFEAGFSLKRVDGTLKLETMFLFGRIFTPPTKEPEVDFGLLHRAVDGVVRGRVAPLLRETNLSGLSGLGSADALAFEPVAGRLFVLVSDRPHPWQVGAMENVYSVVRNALTAPRPQPARAAPLRKMFR